MNISSFIDDSALLTENELNKTKLFAFYYLKTKNLTEFNKTNIKVWFSGINLPEPNVARLTRKMSSSKLFIKGSIPNSFKLHITTIKTLEKEYPMLNNKNEDVVSLDTIIPITLYSNTRGYIESIAKQINASFEYNIYDGCAVLMRRLIEILLILSFENLKIQDEIKDSSGKYNVLELIINRSKSNNILNLSINSKKTIDTFRQLGNFSAHKIHYNCSKSDLEKKVLLDYRVIVEELLYKAGIKK